MDLRLYGLQDLADEGHDACNIAAFCRNPLHPGPCKGWKHTLKAVAPGLHKAVEDTRLERVHARRKERADKATAEGRKAPRVRKLKHEREATKKTGPRDGDGDGKLREGEEGKAGRRVRDERGELLVVTGERGKGNAKAKAALAKWDESGATGEGMTDDEVGLALTGAQANGDYGSAQEIVTEYKKRVLNPDGTRKTKPKGKAGVRSTRTGDDGDDDIVEDDDVDVDVKEPKVLKGDRQRASLGAVVRAGDTGYENKRGFLTGKDRKWLLAEGLVEERDDGRLVATDHGRASHEASIPRRDGEEIGWDGKTASERARELEVAKGAEKARLEAEAKETFLAGIPPLPSDREGGTMADFMGTNVVGARAAGKKLAEGLQKDLGEGTDDFGADVSPAARNWSNRMAEVDRQERGLKQTLARGNWLRAAALADPDNAEQYKALAKENSEAWRIQQTATSRAVDAANAARDELAQAIIGRYAAKGKRKTVASLKIPEAKRDPNPNIYDNPGEDRIRAAAARGDAAIKGLDHNLNDGQQAQAKRVRNGYGAAVVENEKAEAAFTQAQDEERRARGVPSELLRMPSGLRDEKWHAEMDAARVTEKAASERLAKADARRRDSREALRRADVTLVATTDHLREEQAYNGGPRKESSIEREQRERKEGAAELEERRAITEAGVRALASNRTKLRAEAKKRGIEPGRGESDESLVKKVVEHEEARLLRENPPGLGGVKGLDPEVVAEVHRQAVANPHRATPAQQRFTQGGAEKSARRRVERGQIPWAVANAAVHVAQQRGADARGPGGLQAALKLMGLPELPKGTGPSGLRTQEDFTRNGWKRQKVKLSELKAGDLLGGKVITSTSDPNDRGEVAVQGLGMLGMDVERPQPDEETEVWRRDPS